MNKKTDKAKITQIKPNVENSNAEELTQPNLEETHKGPTDALNIFKQLLETDVEDEIWKELLLDWCSKDKPEKDKVINRMVYLLCRLSSEYEKSKLSRDMLEMASQKKYHILQIPYIGPDRFHYFLYNYDIIFTNELFQIIQKKKIDIKNSECLSIAFHNITQKNALKMENKTGGKLLFKICSWNINTMKRKDNIVNHLLTEYDILFLQETGDKNDQDIEVNDNILSYFLFQEKSYGKLYRGLECYVKKTVCKEKPKLEVRNKSYIIISLPQITVVNVYVPQYSDDEKKKDIIKEIVNELKKRTTTFIIMGDFNLSPRKVDIALNSMNSETTDSNYVHVLSSEKPTNLKGGGTNIDSIAFCGNIWAKNIDVGFNEVQDHVPLFADVYSYSSDDNGDRKIAGDSNEAISDGKKTILNNISETRNIPVGRSIHDNAPNETISE